MALSGSFYNYPVGEFGLYCTWSGVQNPSTNSTTITLNVYLRYYTINVHARSDGKVNINGTQQTYSTPRIYDMESTEWHNVLFATKTQTVTHNADGTKTNVPISASWRFSGTYMGVQIGTITASTTVNLDPISSYTLTIEATTGFSATVNRTSSVAGSTGNLSNGARLYYGDKLKITFNHQPSYEITVHNVNNQPFESGATYTVVGNTTVTVAGIPLASKVAATNADVGSVSTITITKYNNSFYHSLQFVVLAPYGATAVSGFIRPDGSISSSEVKFNQTSVAFTVPNDVYTVMSDRKSAQLSITCKTYTSQSSTAIFGQTGCDITVTASKSTSAPIVNGTVVDTNADTIALTGDSAKLIRYKSTALCTISASARNYATLTSKTINDVEPTNDQRTFTNVSATSFVFKATDTRGYTTSVTKNPTVVPYVKLTCNPIIYRPVSTGSEINMTVNGDVFRGSFGEYDNSMTLRYRFKESEGSYGSWTTVSSGIVYNNDTYNTPTPISLGGDFDYRKEYVFQIQVYDGANGTTLTSVTKTVTLQGGIPVFDWGKNDFNINVPLNVAGNITVNGDSIIVRRKKITLNSVPITTQSVDGAYYYQTGYDPADYDIFGNIFSLMVENWTGAASSFTPYYNNNKISFMSDISQTVSKIVLIVSYIEADIPTYTVTFSNDGLTLQTVTGVPHGGNATYTGATPTKRGVQDPENYEFIGWAPPPTNITQDTICYALFAYAGEITDSWATISAHSLAGDAENYYSVGDCKSVSLNGTMGTLSLNETLYVYIIGFDHNIQYENNGITFQGFKTLPLNGIDVCLIDSYYGSMSTGSDSKWFNMNHNRNQMLSHGGWAGCDMRYDVLGSTDVEPIGHNQAVNNDNGKIGYDATSTCATNPVAETLMSCLPSDLRLVMKPILKYTCNKSTCSDASSVTSTTDYLPLLSEFEVFGTRGFAGQYEIDKQSQYAYYVAGNSKIKYKHSSTASAAYWYTRSSNGNTFTMTEANGTMANSFSVTSRGISPIFLI